MQIISSKVPFNELCGLCERISNIRGIEAKKNLLQQFIVKWRQLHTDTYMENQTSKLSKVYSSYTYIHSLTTGKEEGVGFV